MKLVIPVSRHDVKLIENLYKAFDAFPFSREHELLIIGSKENEVAIQSLNEGIKHLFAKSECKLIEDTMLGWPGSCNFYFQQACYHLGNSPSMPFLWYELDSTPLKEGWLDLLAQSYHADTTVAAREGRKPRTYLGAKERNYEGRNGELLPESIAGSRMSQVGIYDPMITQIPVLSSLSATTRHWSSVIQWYVTPNMIDSPLIQNNWRTLNYRRDAWDIICDSDANLAWDVHFSKPVSKEAVLLHGCKDGTLLDLLLNNKDTNKNKPMKVVTNISLADAKMMAEEFDERDEEDSRNKKSTKKFVFSKKEDNKEE